MQVTCFLPKLQFESVILSIQLFGTSKMSEMSNVTTEVILKNIALV